MDSRKLRNWLGLRTIDELRPTRIRQVIQESSNIRTFGFEDAQSMKFLPGQFVMVWLPRVGEFSMSLSLPLGANLASITVKAMGSGSSRLYESRKGDLIGIRGPYGNSFNLSRLGGKSALMVGGGTGIVPLIALASYASRQKNQTKLSVVIAAKTKDEMPFLDTAMKILGKRNVFPATDDGSLGFHGLAHEKVQELVASGKYQTIFSCGPEKMMCAVYGIARNWDINVQFSLERIMKCGIGICGSCCLGQYVLCKDGPVLTDRELENLKSEFGISGRDKTGTLVPK